MRYKGIPLLPLLTTAAATTMFVTYRSSMHAAHERLGRKSTVIPSPSGFHSRVNGSQRGIVMDTKKTRWRWLLWSPWLAKANRSCREWQTRRPGAVIVAIKTIHTLAWFSIESCMVYLLYAGFAKRSDQSVAVAAAVVGGECLIFAANGFHCPLTKLAVALGAESGTVTDIYLPKWFAHYLPTIHVPLIVLAVFLHGRNLLQQRKRG